MNQVGGHFVVEDPGRWIERYKGWSRERLGDLGGILVWDGWRNALLLVLQKKEKKNKKKVRWLLLLGFSGLAGFHPTI